jgi:hypothetical protein
VKPRSINGRRRDSWVVANLFLLLLLCYTYTLPRWIDPNQNLGMFPYLPGVFSLTPLLAIVAVSLAASWFLARGESTATTRTGGR